MKKTQKESCQSFPWLNKQITKALGQTVKNITLSKLRLNTPLIYT